MLRTHVFSLAAMLALSLASSCSRTALDAPCPNGYAQSDAGVCVCSTDEGCPTGYRCEQAVCQCRATNCCPAGYEYSTDSEQCVCRASECCPKDHRWLADEKKCVCGTQDCCPGGYTFDTTSQSCQCAADECCPVGFVWDSGKKACACASDACCPVDYHYDAVGKDCVCSKTECCPSNHVYDGALGACVCVGDACCPTGFVKGPNNRCVCVNDASCQANQFCDPTSGGCRCKNNAGCPSSDYCNALGFCQSLTACTSNLDCPSGTFCDVTTTKCLPNGPCTLDEQCVLGDVCRSTTLTCAPGCRDDGDCPTKLSCVNGACTFFCRNNDFCPVNQFCNTATGQCANRANRVDCRACTNFGNECGLSSVAQCLTFVTEGQTGSFCGMMCQTDADCPSGYDCGGVIFSCTNDTNCQAVSGDTITCKSYQVENESGAQFYCADSTGQPHEYFKACAPSSGFCPAVASP